MGGILAADEMMKALAGYTFEHMGIASYRIWIATAECIGDTDTVTACKRILVGELAMAKWLEDNVGSATQEFLRRDESDVAARRYTICFHHVVAIADIMKRVRPLRS
jgi:ferritin-like metal-binding protein YciE